jgi:hypothetical protein
MSVENIQSLFFSGEDDDESSTSALTSAAPGAALRNAYPQGPKCTLPSRGMLTRCTDSDVESPRAEAELPPAS